MSVQNLSVEKINRQIEDLVLSTADAVHTVSTLLRELRRRGEHHPYMKDGVLRWFEEIASGRISAKAAFLLAGNKLLISCIIDMDHEDQDGIASGRPVPVAEDNGTSIIMVERPLLQMDRVAMEVAFGDGEVRPPSEQKTLLRRLSEPKKPVEAKGRIGVDEKTGSLVFGVMRVNLFELREPLLALGYRLVKAQETKK